MHTDAVYELVILANSVASMMHDVLESREPV